MGCRSEAERRSYDSRNSQDRPNSVPEIGDQTEETNSIHRRGSKADEAAKETLAKYFFKIREFF